MSGNENSHWKPILDVVPEMYHDLIKPKLADWDKGIAQRFQEKDQQYSGFKPFVDNNIDPTEVQNAFEFVQNLQSDPKKVIEALDKDWDLKLFTPAPVAPVGDPADPFNPAPQTPNPPAAVDFANHPAFKSMMEQINSLQETITSQTEAQQQQQAVDAYEKELKDFLSDESRKHVDPVIFTSIRATGLNNDEALEKYNAFIAGITSSQVPDPNANQQTITPTIMGGEGNVGSGAPASPPKWGEVSNTDTNTVVADFLRKQRENN